MGSNHFILSGASIKTNSDTKTHIWICSVNNPLMVNDDSQINFHDTGHIKPSPSTMEGNGTSHTTKWTKMKDVTMATTTVEKQERGA